jgi:hypothetical protein
MPGRQRRLREFSIKRGKSMPPQQSKRLKVGTRVCWNGDWADCGTVTANHARYVTIKWEDGHQSFSGHKEMKRVELLVAER